MWLYNLYKLITNKLAFLIKWHIESRIKLGKEDPERYMEKFGISSVARPKGNIIWFHAASVGEVNSILPLINEMIPHHKNVHFLITTSTVTSANIVNKVKLERVIHQYCPVDIPQSVQAFLNFWKPKLAVFIESEIWPNLLVQTAKKNKIILLNARLSDNSYKRWRNNKKTAKFLFSKFAHILPWSEQDKKKLSAFVPSKKIHYIGNLKFASPPPKTKKSEIAKLKKEIGKRPFWLAASTHKGEEEIILETHNILRKTYKDLLTIILPRHPNRGSEVQNKCSKLNNVLRSTNKPISKSTEVYIADTLGEVGVFYHLSSIVFLGGSLIKHGGQNILEPARCNCALITGEHTRNFADIIDKLKMADALEIATNPRAISMVVDEFLNNKSSCKAYAARALTVANQTNSILDDTVKFISKLIKK